MRFASHAPLLLAALIVGACNRATPPTAPNATPADIGAPPPPSSTVLGKFAGVGGHSGQGSVTFSGQNGVGRLDFSADFNVSGVPGPYVYLNTTNNANTGRPLRVSALRSNSGAQTYSFQLPAGVTYAYVLIWCDPYNVPVAEATVPALP